MPSLDHEALIALFRNRPTLAAELLRDSFGFDLPGFVQAHIEDSDLTTIVPASYEADLVISLRGERAKLGVIVEVQLAPDEDEPSSWLVYVANLHAKLRAPIVLLIVTPSERVVRLCSRRLFVQPSIELRPFVLGPKDVPIVEDERIAIEAPELAVLSALTHGQGQHAFAVGRAALRAISLLDGDNPCSRPFIHGEPTSVQNDQERRSPFPLAFGPPPATVRAQDRHHFSLETDHGSQGPDITYTSQSERPGSRVPASLLYRGGRTADGRAPSHGRACAPS